MSSTYRLVIAAYPYRGISYVTTLRVPADSQGQAMERGFDAVDTNLSTYQHVRKIGVIRREDRKVTGTVIDHTTYDMDHERF